MNSGSFFRLDLETSKVVDGVTFFNYIDLPDLDNKEDVVSYPIRLSISADSVSIFTHYYSSDQLPHHIEEVIIHLPYGKKDAEGSFSAIKRMYNTPFPLSDYLVDLLKKRYTDEAPEGSGYYYMRQSQINRDSYSALTIWGLLNKEKTRINLLDNKGQITKFLRKLLLDFMFDLMHSDVFECSKYYSQMREGLMNDIFFSSIIKKSEYYYNRRLIKSKFENAEISNIEAWHDCANCLLDAEKQASKQILSFANDKNYSESEKSNIINAINKKKSDLEAALRVKYPKEYDTIKTLKCVYVEKLDETEKEWLDVIMSPMAEKHFSFFPEWYEDQEKRKLGKGEFRVSESWFVDPEEEMERVVFPLKEKNDKKERIHFLNSFELSFLIGSKDNTSVLSRNTRISKWLYQRFDFHDAFRLHSFNGGHLFFFFTLALFAFVLIGTIVFPRFGIFVEQSNIFWQSPKWYGVFPGIAVVLFILKILHLSFEIYRKKESKKIDDKLVLQRLWREYTRTIKLIVCFSCIAAFLFFYEPNNLCKSLLMIVGSIIIAFCFIRIKYIINNVHLLLPRLVASITAAWIMLVIGNDIFQEYLSWPIWLIIVIVVFNFILYENNKTLPKIDTKWKIRRAIELMLISYSMSLIVGFFALDILRKTKPDTIIGACQKQSSPSSFTWYLFENSDSLSLTVFPEYLIQFSFLAMFIGVFIQMIFEEKKITEM